MSLGEVLRGVATGDYRVNPDAPVQVVVAEIRKARMLRQVTIQSFDWGALMRMREVEPRLDAKRRVAREHRRERLAYRVFREHGLPASRASHVELEPSSARRVHADPVERPIQRSLGLQLVGRRRFANPRPLLEAAVKVAPRDDLAPALQGASGNLDRRLVSPGQLAVLVGDRGILQA